MARSKYINTFDTTADYNNYIDSALPEFPNVGYDKEAGKVNIRRQSPNNYQIWGTTTATSNFNIKVNNSTNVEVTVDPLLGEFYLQGWTGTLTSLYQCFFNNTDITSIKKFALDTSNVTNLNQMFKGCSNLTSINLSGCNTYNVTAAASFLEYSSKCTNIDLSGWDLSNVSNTSFIFPYAAGKSYDLYITVEATLMKLTNNLSSQGDYYVPQAYTIHYNDVDYKWQNHAWTPQS